MGLLEKRIGRLEQIGFIHGHNYKILMRHEGEPKHVTPDDGQPYTVVSFVKSKQWEPDHEEA